MWLPPPPSLPLLLIELYNSGGTAPVLGLLELLSLHKWGYGSGSSASDPGFAEDMRDGLAWALTRPLATAAALGEAREEYQRLMEEVEAVEEAAAVVAALEAVVALQLA